MRPSRRNTKVESWLRRQVMRKANGQPWEIVHHGAERYTVTIQVPAVLRDIVVRINAVNYDPA